MFHFDVLTRVGSVKMPQVGDANNSKRIVLNSADSLFSEIRGENFANIGSILSRRTKELSNVMNVC